ncbi:DUF4118 domain-containing protein [Actinoallomurus acaciae]|uniref:DUF4118 domain-containing protein n=1 Tax=Actinoallomurus acaciae TaxID=502577 RepID=A0ABV5YY43_9ACTN
MALCLTVETLVGLGLAKVVPVESLGVLYLVGLLVVTSFWGLPMGLLMAVASAIVFDFVLLPPVWELGLLKGQDLVVLGVFMALALPVCALAQVARLLSGEVEARQEADLSADLARLLLRAPDLSAARPATARLLADALDLPSAAIEPGDVPAGNGGLAFPLRGDGVQATLLVPGGLPRPVARRLRERIVPLPGGAPRSRLRTREGRRRPAAQPRRTRPHRRGTDRAAASGHAGGAPRSGAGDLRLRRP